MKKFSLILPAAAVVGIGVFSLISFGSSETETPSQSPTQQEVHAKFPVFTFTQLVTDWTDTVVLAKVESVKKKDQVHPPAQLATLAVKKVFYGTVPNQIILDQAANYVEPGKTYIMFLQKKGEYYYEPDANSIIQETNGKFKVRVPDFQGEWTADEFGIQFAHKKSILPK